MKFFTRQVRSLFPARKRSDASAAPVLEFVKRRKPILRELILSKESGNIVGVYCSALGDGMFLTGVQDVYSVAAGEFVVFNPYDFSGKLLIRTTVELGEIQMVCSFDRLYKNPLFAGTSDKYYHLAAASTSV